jgi:hypothetical protein
MRDQYAGRQNQDYDSIAKVSSETRRTPPLESALDHLTQTVEGLANDASELCRRLETVSQPVPMPVKEGVGVRAGSACYYQNRMDELRERIQTISAGLREAREMLCI